ncbi:Translocation protein S66 [Coemansia guatemalensis]|uniref:Translocation protein S66 n=1 Tax=Coemansia guatemalensis TaxID=2761395 RepID=A0A9W8LVM7_9FUNG|nr:Translocation protein S66 [Coemansia guatemalensis]
MASGTGMLLVYILGWGLVFGTFVHYYHKRKAQKLTRLEAWYPSHPERDIYYALVNLQKSTPTAVPSETLRSALFRRAMTDIMRAVEIKTNKPTLLSLVKSGAMSEELLHQFNAAEAENDAEMMSVVQEAEKLQKGWGGSIFYAASEMVNNTRLRELREEMLKLNFESANCNRSIMMENMSPAEREKATTEGTKENEALKKNDIILSSIFNMPIGEGVKIAAAAQAKRQAEAQKAAVAKGEKQGEVQAKEKQEEAKGGKQAKGQESEKQEHDNQLESPEDAATDPTDTAAESKEETKKD